LPVSLSDIFIYIREAPATYLNNGTVGLSGQTLHKTGQT